MKICLEVDPEEKLGVDMKTKKIIATSTVSIAVFRIQSICGNAMWFSVEVYMVKIHVEKRNTDYESTFFAVNKKRMSFCLH